MEVNVVGYDFERGPPEDRPCKVGLNLG